LGHGAAVINDGEGEASLREVVKKHLAMEFLQLTERLASKSWQNVVVQVVKVRFPRRWRPLRESHGQKALAREPLQGQIVWFWLCLRRTRNDLAKFCFCLPFPQFSFLAELHSQMP